MYEVQGSEIPYLNETIFNDNRYSNRAYPIESKMKHNNNDTKLNRKQEAFIMMLLNWKKNCILLDQPDEFPSHFSPFPVRFFLECFFFPQRFTCDPLKLRLPNTKYAQVAFIFSQRISLLWLLPKLIYFIFFIKCLVTNIYIFRTAMDQIEYIVTSGFCIFVLLYRLL